MEQIDTNESFDSETNRNPEGSSDDSHLRNQEAQQARQLDRWRIILQKRLAVRGVAIGGMVNARRTARKQAERIGQILLQIKDVLGHGKWLLWLAEHTLIDGRQIITERVARNWMSLARNRKLIKTELNSDPNISEGLRVIRNHRAQRQQETQDNATHTEPDVPADSTPTQVQSTYNLELPESGVVQSVRADQTVGAGKKHVSKMLRSAFNIYKQQLECAPRPLRRIIERQLRQLLNLATGTSAANQTGGIP